MRRHFEQGSFLVVQKAEIKVILFRRVHKPTESLTVQKAEIKVMLFRRVHKATESHC
jgi:hypothetical protein